MFVDASLLQLRFQDVSILKLFRRNLKSTHSPWVSEDDKNLPRFRVATKDCVTNLGVPGTLSRDALV